MRPVSARLRAITNRSSSSLNRGNQASSLRLIGCHGSRSTSSIAGGRAYDRRCAGRYVPKQLHVGKFISPWDAYQEDHLDVRELAVLQRLESLFVGCGVVLRRGECLREARRSHLLKEQLQLAEHVIAHSLVDSVLVRPVAHAKRRNHGASRGLVRVKRCSHSYQGRPWSLSVQFISRLTSPGQFSQNHSLPCWVIISWA